MVSLLNRGVGRACSLFLSKLIIMTQKIYLTIHGILFGVRAKGEKPIEPTLRPERPMDMDGFNEWCQHIRKEIIGKKKRVYSSKQKLKV